MGHLPPPQAAAPHTMCWRRESSRQKSAGAAASRVAAGAVNGGTPSAEWRHGQFGLAMPAGAQTRPCRGRLRAISDSVVSMKTTGEACSRPISRTTRNWLGGESFARLMLRSTRFRRLYAFRWENTCRRCGQGRAADALPAEGWCCFSCGVCTATSREDGILAACRSCKAPHPATVYDAHQEFGFIPAESHGEDCLRLVPGCRAIVDVPYKTPGSMFNGQEVTLLSWLPDALPMHTSEALGFSNVDGSWLALVVGGYSLGRVMPIIPFPPTHLRPVRYKYERPLPWPHPERCLVMRGGWEMNHTGLFHSFEQPARPGRMSFQLRVSRTTRRRSYFNVFFSPQPRPFVNERVFWAGNSHFPPSPPDLFTILLSTSARSADESDSESTCDAMIWLPSGTQYQVDKPLVRGEW